MGSETGHTRAGEKAEEAKGADKEGDAIISQQEAKKEAEYRMVLRKVLQPQRAQIIFWAAEGWIEDANKVRFID